MSDLIRAKDVAKRLAQSVRKIQEMAARGDIPSAVKIGSIWTFDPDVIEGWLRKMEARACRKTSTKETVSGMRDFRSAASFDVSAYEHAIFGPQGRGSKRSKRKRPTQSSDSASRTHGPRPSPVT